MHQQSTNKTLFLENSTLPFLLSSNSFKYHDSYGLLIHSVLFPRILDIYRKVYGETDGRVGMAMCSLAYAMCAKGNSSLQIFSYAKVLTCFTVITTIYSLYLNLLVL